MGGCCCCCCCCYSDVQGTILSEAGDVLPTLLERFLTSKEHRIGFEENIEGSEAEIVLQIFKPLLYFELGSFRDIKASDALGNLFKNLYILPHQGELLEGFAANHFKAFLECEEITVEEFNILRTSLDTEITLKYLLPYQRDNNIELVHGVGNAMEGNQLVDMNENYEEMFQQEQLTRQPSIRQSAKGAISAIRKIVPVFNIKKLAFGGKNQTIPSLKGSHNSRISWMGMMSIRHLDNADLEFSPTDLKFMAPPPGLSKAEKEAGIEQG